jgi:hypothetical protein
MGEIGGWGSRGRDDTYNLLHDGICCSKGGKDGIGWFSFHTNHKETQQRENYERKVGHERMVIYQDAVRNMLRTCQSH